MKGYDAIVLAGGDRTKPFAAVVEVAGRPMVQIVTEALRASECVARIFIVGDTASLSLCRFPAGTHLLESASTIMGTLQLGMEAAGPADKVLVVTADIPLITPAAIEDFTRRCAVKEADLYYPVVRKEDNDRKYPGCRRTYAKLRDGTFTGGNIFLVRPAIITRCRLDGQRLIDNRKHPVRLCHILGWRFVFQFLLGILTLERVERRVEAMFDIRGAVIISDHPEVGVDVDKPSDLALVRAVLSAEGGRASG